MNNNERITNVRLACKALQEAFDNEDDEDIVDAADDLLEAFEALDKSITSGEDLPDDWGGKHR
jgi:hypothetical protein